MISRKFHNKRSRISCKHFCLLQDNTRADNCCNSNKICTRCHPCSSVKQRTCNQSNNRKLCSTRDKSSCHNCHLTVSVIFNRSGCHNSRNTASGTNQHRNKGFTGQAEFTEDTIHNKGDTRHVSTAFQKCQEQK